VVKAGGQEGARARPRAEVAGCGLRVAGGRGGTGREKWAEAEDQGKGSGQRIKAQQRGRKNGTSSKQQAAGRVGEGAGKWRRKQCRRGRDAGRRAGCGAQQWRPWMRARLGSGYGRGRIAACTESVGELRTEVCHVEMVQCNETRGGSMGTSTSTSTSISTSRRPARPGSNTA
jgi:hypothetical protein